MPMTNELPVPPPSVSYHIFVVDIANAVVPSLLLGTPPLFDTK